VISIRRMRKEVLAVLGVVEVKVQVLQNLLYLGP
jgi:hypothetical protein